MIIILNETIVNGYKSEFLLVTSLVSILFGIFIIITRNPVISVLFLIGLFISISLHLMMLGLFFIGLSYLLVYVGAVSILFIFILMLINVRVSELLTEGKNSIPLAIIALITFNLTIDTIVPYSMYVLHAFSKISYKSLLSLSHLHNISSTSSVDILVSIDAKTEIGNVVSKCWDSCLIEYNHITSIGNVLYTNLFIFLIITSLILLLAMVGSIVITTRKIDIRQT